MAGGAAVTVLTKSGTNEFHGSGCWLHREREPAGPELGEHLG